MPEELNTSGAAPGEGASTAVVDGDPIQSGDNLQQQMTGDFFDDNAFYDEGTDAVVDNLGNPLRDADGNIIRNMDEYKKSQSGTGKDPTTTGKTQPGTGETGKQTTTEKLPSGFDAAFTKDGQLDFDGVMKASAGIKDYSYQMRSTFKTPEGGQGNQPAADPKERIKTTIEEFRNELTTQRLEPIKKLYDGISQAFTRTGQQLPQEVFDEINKVYQEIDNTVKNSVETRRDELLGEILDERTTEADMKLAEQKSSSNFKAVADQMIPHVQDSERKDKLSELVFGHEGEDGKFVPGYGADVISALFDAAMSGKTFNSPEEWKQSYNRWWYNYSSEPKNVQLLASVSFSRYVAANHAKYRGEYRKAWEKETADKNKNKNLQSRASAAVPTEVSTADSLMNYHRVPARNL